MELAVRLGAPGVYSPRVSASETGWKEYDSNKDPHTRQFRARRRAASRSARQTTTTIAGTRRAVAPVPVLAERPCSVRTHLSLYFFVWRVRAVCGVSVSYTHLTLPTKA